MCLFSVVLADLFGMQSFCSAYLWLIFPCFWWLWDSAPQPCESQLCARYSTVLGKKGDKGSTYNPPGMQMLFLSSPGLSPSLKSVNKRAVL